VDVVVVAGHEDAHEEVDDREQTGSAASVHRSSPL
jgi:hypothetical protein